MKILVTGKNGALGQAFQVIEKDWSQYQFIYPTSSEMDLLAFTSVEDGLCKWQPDYLIHCAALSGGVGISKKHPATLLRDNVLMSINVMEAARLCGVKKVIMSLSSGMYPTTPPMDALPEKFIWSEEYIHQGNPHPSNYAYAHAKRLIEPMIRAYREEYGLNAIGLVPNGIFGEGDYFGLEDCNMLAALISKCYTAKKTKEEIVLWGDGSPLRELTYAKDLARAYMWALENYDEPQILNVGNTKEVSVMEIAQKLWKMFNLEVDITFDTTKPNGPYRKPTDNSKFLGLSGFEYTDFDHALRNTVEWYRDMIYTNPELIRTANKVRI